MARQDVVRALVPADEVEAVVAGLVDDVGLDPAEIEVTTPEPATYRDEGPDLELHELVRHGRTRTIVGAAVGALIGLAIAWLVPFLREWMPWTGLLLAFGGAWATGAVAAARAVQVHRQEDDRPEDLHRLDEREARRERIVTIHELHRRNAVVDHLIDRGITLLDSQHPRVGGDEPGARPSDPDQDRAGPPESA